MRVVILGAAGDTANLGVNALMLSVLAGIWEHHPSAQVTVADHGRGVRRHDTKLGDVDRAWTSVGVINTRRWYRPESLRLQSVIAPIAPQLVPATRAIDEADAVLDISGGDSFTDLYGQKRLTTMLEQKRLVLSVGTPLGLLPQTYGPFEDAGARAAAADIVRRSATCWARDERSYEVLLSLLGDDADEHRHRLGVDVAFSLPPQEPPAEESPATREWLAARDPGRPLAGINVSGLVRWVPDRFGVTFDYVHAVVRAVRALVDEGADVLLVPHQINRTVDHDGPSDNDGVDEVAAAVADLGDHVATVEMHSVDPRHAKWWIKQCDWFTGPRMHATIAALSSGVPTLSTAYSMKAAGVFATAGVGDAVVDLDSLDADSFVKVLVESFREREATADRLRTVIEDLRRRSSAQIADVLRVATASADG